MLRYLKNPALDLTTGTAVVSDYLHMLSQGGIDKRFFAGCLSISLSALTRHGTRQTQAVVGALTKFCLNRLPKPYSSEAVDALSGWLSGHFLTLQDVGLKDDVAEP